MGLTAQFDNVLGLTAQFDNVLDLTAQFDNVLDLTGQFDNVLEVKTFLLQHCKHRALQHVMFCLIFERWHWILLA